METKYNICETTTIYRMTVSPAERHKVISSKNIYDILLPYFEANIEHKEMFFSVYLNRNNEILSIQKHSEGTICGTMADVKDILKPAINLLASGVILAHNHPSGNLISSREDDMLTKKIGDVCKLIDVRLLDHVILTKYGYYSYADEGNL